MLDEDVGELDVPLAVDVLDPIAVGVTAALGSTTTSEPLHPLTNTPQPTAVATHHLTPMPER